MEIRIPYSYLANAIPGIMLNLYGGVFADRLDQRRLIVAAPGLILYHSQTSSSTHLLGS